jgi:WD40-like Beta Propeller Repeat
MRLCRERLGIGFYSHFNNNLYTYGKKSMTGHKIRYILFLLLILLAFSLYTLSQHGGKRGKNEKRSNTAEENTVGKARGAVLEDLHGFVVWSTNRYGNHELVQMTLPDKKIKRLTNNSLADTFPRISPDGSKIVFTRAQRPKVSQRQYLLWDIYLLDLRTSQEKFLVKNGYQPSWSQNGNAIYFQLNGNSIGKYDLATGRESMVFKSGESVHVPQGVSLGMPSWSEKNRAVAVTFRDGLDATGIIQTNGDVLLLGEGCQIAWSPDESWLYYVDHDWKRNNIFYRIDIRTKKKILFFDSPTQFSHEYFPKLDRDEKYLVYGASTGGHEHDQADYEIFLWRVGSAFDTSVRLTFDPANDCWPDIYLKP